MRVNKQLFALVLCFLVLFSIPTINIFAWGGAGAEASPGNDNGSRGDYPLTNGYGFRVYLYDFDKYGEFWEGDSPYNLYHEDYLHFSDFLDRSASESAFYLGIPSDYKAYDAQYGSTPWVSINTMSADEFNTMPGMSGYSNPVGNYSRIDFTQYVEVFNKISSQTETINGMKEVLDWFSIHGVDTSEYNPEATLVVVEPVVKWYYGSMKWVTTYQNARKYDGTRSGVNEYFNFTWSLQDGTQVEGDRYIPLSTTKATVKAHAVLGGFYQSYLFQDGDCLTRAYDATSGFSFYGCIKVDPTRIAANIAVLYEGAYGGVTNKESIINYIGLNNKYPYKHWTGDGWEDNKDITDYLGIEEVSQLDEYTIKMFDILNLRVSQKMSYQTLYENLRIDDFEFNWASLDAEGADYNFGKSYGLIGLTYKERKYIDLIPFTLELCENTGFHPYLSPISPVLSPSNSTSVSARNLFYTATLYSTLGAHPVQGVMEGENIGIAVEFLMKTPIITSNVITLKTVTDGSAAEYTVDSIQYKVDKIKELNTSDEARCIAIVPNYSSIAYSEDTIAELCSNIQGTTEEEIIDSFQGLFADAFVCDVVEGSKTVKLGNEIFENKNYGYTVYELEIIEVQPPLTPTPTPTPEITPVVTPEVTPEAFEGSIEEVLQDYELNRVLPSVMNVLDTRVKINPNLWTVDPDDRSYVSCWLCPFDGYYYNTTSYDIVIYDKSTGMTVDKDSSLSDTKLLLYNTSNGTFNTRDNVVSGWGINTSGISNYVVDYAFNMVRSISGDKRTVSTISSQSISPSFGKDVLGLAYDNVPKSKTVASKFRDSFVKVGTISDTLKFDAKYKVTGSKDKYDTVGETHSCISWIDEETFNSNTEYYHSLISIPDALKAFKVGNESYATVEENFNVQVNKYSTEWMPFGKNDVDTGIVALQPAPDTKEEKKISEPYAIAGVQNHNIVLKFYPEVEMKAHEYSGSKISEMGAVKERTVLTMGEELRAAESSSLYIYSVRTANEGLSDITGMTYSDAALTGNIVSKYDLPVIPAGADLNVVGEPNFTVHLAGYSLDVINKSVDGDGLRISNSKTISYNDIIADNSEIYSKWGNAYTNKLYKNFENWVEQMADARNYQADLRMVIKGRGYPTKIAEAFNASIGYITGGDCIEEEVFPLRIKNGVLDKSTESYKSLIKRIAADYNCEYADAIEVFEASGLYTSILNAIESSASSSNNSQSGPTTLGSASHWYDEQVKTLVIRRYEATPLQFCDLIASDKLDFGAATDTGKTATGKFYFTLYFGKEIEPFEGYTIYEPANEEIREKAVETGNVIINGLYIDGADFIIESFTTSDF